MPRIHANQFLFFFAYGLEKDELHEQDVPKIIGLVLNYCSM